MSQPLRQFCLEKIRSQYQKLSAFGGRWRRWIAHVPSTWPHDGCQNMEPSHHEKRGLAKDMSIIYQALDDLDVPAPLFTACIPIYKAAMSQGHALHDTAAVYAVLEQMAGEA